MRPFRIALGILTCLKFTGPAPTQNELSRSLAHFPLIGILIATVLILLDQGMSRWISVFVTNALWLVILTAVRFSRGVQDVAISFSLPFRIFFLVLKYFLFWGIPAPLRWISLTFMTTFSSGALALALRRISPQIFDLENILWSSLICIFLGVICGTLGIVVTGVCSALLALALRFLKDRLEWIEEGMEVVVLGAVMVFHYSWKYFWNY